MTATPYGLRDIKITPYTDAAGTQLAADSIDLPYARTLAFSETEDFNELRGDDRVVAQHGAGPTVEFDFESGGLPFEAFRAMAGGSIIESGLPGNGKKVYTKKATDQRPYFRIEGQAISDSGGDVRCVIFKAKCTGELAGEFADGEFFLTSGSGVGIADADDNLYSFIENEQVSTFEEPNSSASAPRIDSATPTGAGEGDTVLVKGARFNGTTSVTVGGVEATSFSVISNEELVVVLPAGAAGSASIVVTNATGASDEFPYTRS